MEVTSDAILRGPVWAETIDRLVVKTGGILFENNWDLYALSVTIGMMHDCQIESKDMIPDDYDAEPRYVPRNVLGHVQRKPLLEFMFQSAMVTTKHLDLTENERLELAFGNEKKIDFNPIAFLTKFANYGVTVIQSIIEDTNDVETLETLMVFLNDTYEKGVLGIADDTEIEDTDE